ncbi:type II secretion system protein [Sulfurimonas sp.]|uniref:type II secretion system protein n=1 Tax=Sulfurimonas sp. TaxID=2022749 RepID=UPI0035691045
MINRAAFTMLELIFVIVIMGILGKFGVEFLAQAYNSFIFSNINNTLQSNSAAAIETIASRLQFRVKDSIIARQDAATFQALANSTLAENARILEWVASDIDGFRGNSLPLWSGIIDLDASSADLLNSPDTNTTALNTQIGILSHSSGTGINNAAIYFIGSNNNVNTGYGWDGNPITTQNSVMHPIRAGAAIDEFVPVNGSTGVDNNFSGVDVYEYYQLAWTAYAVEHQVNGDLVLWYDYQPWAGETYTDGQHDILMQGVDTFRFKAVGSVVKIQVCVNTDLVEDYSLCKEKTIY